VLVLKEGEGREGERYPASMSRVLSRGEVKSLMYITNGSTEMISVV